MKNPNAKAQKTSEKLLQKPAQKKPQVDSAKEHKRRFDQLLDDAVFGIKRK